MRMTVTIEDDIAARIEELRKRDGQSLKQVVNLLLRDGLHRQGRPRAKPYRTRPRKLGLRPGFDASRLSQLADEVDGRLETEAHLRPGPVP